MQVDLPGLPQGVGLDKVPLVMNVESMLHGVFFEIGHETGDID
jgi:hypothetical protein